jgi:uncharacterized protein YdhG (YjbR/CyaY superfamily)
MAEKTKTKTSSRKTAADASSEGFMAAERAAMKERAKEAKAEARANMKREDGERHVREKIGEMPKRDRALAERVHEIVTATAPDLMPRTWYGMPAYAKDGKILCFFQAASKFDSRYATLGFNDVATLDDGAMWPTAFALTELTAAEEKRIAALVKKAVG